mmetsp:Transcript_135963/g.322200  ORF Transcript_135963/g.322200 Transcript_135963/m.322200 type:complete len:109 (-) Transcript_135963:103-429(-)
MLRILVVAVSLCLASRAGATRAVDQKLVHLHQDQETLKENDDKDVTNQDEMHGEAKATLKGPDPFATAVCCRCYTATGMRLPATTKLAPPCHKGCDKVPSSNCGSWGS